MLDKTRTFCVIKTEYSGKCSRLNNDCQIFNLKPQDTDNQAQIGFLIINP
jgi:hypothetical protein